MKGFFLRFASVLGLIALFAVVAFFSRTIWIPPLQQGLAAALPGSVNSGEDHPEHDDHGPAADAESLELSPQALKNIGYRPYRVQQRPYTRSITVPAMIVERPGQTHVQVPAPLTGIVTDIFVIEGEAVPPGTKMFTMRLTHEELVSGQGQFLETAEELDVVTRELQRLEAVTEGIIAGRQILQQKYEQQKLAGRLRAQRQGLLLHGLNDEQVDAILQTRDLLQTMNVYAPQPPAACEALNGDLEHVMTVERLEVAIGQQIEAGGTLAVLSDHCSLYVQGIAYEDDAEKIHRAVENQWAVAMAPRRGESFDATNGQSLDILFVAGEVERTSRALHFYAGLTNEIVSDERRDGRRFLQWRFKPGERLELRVPVAQFADRYVLPVGAVVEDGVESFVFVQNGDLFQRVPVHVEHRDRRQVVIAADGTLFPGAQIAGEGAYYMNMQLKNQTGGVDPHAGHSH